MTSKNLLLFYEAQRFIPGGVNSPVRSFKSVGGVPVFIKQGKESKIYGEGGESLIDYCLSWGALILGHTHPKVTEALRRAIKKGTSFGTATVLETELARLIVEAVPSMEQVRLTNSGTEAVMSAIRLARAYTGKRKIIKFEGSYHGHADYLLVKSGSGIATLGIPDSSGVLEDSTKHTIVLPYNNIERVEEEAKKHREDLAAIIVEPVAANCGVILPQPGFLPGLRTVASRCNALLIFDEVITGFRLSYGGAQAFFDVKPDLTCLGKIIGGGLPIGAFGGSKEIMKLLAPLGSVYQAGTLAGNPLAVTAGITTLRILGEDNPYEALENKTQKLCQGIKEKAEKYKVKVRVNNLGSIFSLFFGNDRVVVNYRIAKNQNIGLFKKFFHHLLAEGVYFSPSGFEANFLSTAHTSEDIERTLKVIDKALKSLRRVV